MHLECLSGFNDHHRNENAFAVLAITLGDAISSNGTNDDLYIKVTTMETSIMNLKKTLEY